jgi:hypothetical protein
MLLPEARTHFKMMIAIGELKDLKATAMGYKVVLRHLPDCVLRPAASLPEASADPKRARAGQRLRQCHSTTLRHDRYGVRIVVRL